MDRLNLSRKRGLALGLWGLLISLLLAPIAEAKSPSTPLPARILAYQPLSILIPIEALNPILTKELSQFEGQVIEEGRNRFELSGLRHEVLNSGHLLLNFTVNAERPAPIVGKIKAKARARLELRVSMSDWASSIVAIDSDIRFSNDLLQAAFQIVRGRVERQLLSQVQKALDDINQPINTDHPLLDRMRRAGTLDGNLQANGFFVQLQQR